MTASTYKPNGSIETYLSLEWLETNSLGGYASSTLLNCHTRRYHGLLVSQLKNPGGKFVLFSKMEDSLFDGDKEYQLTTHQYPNFIHEGGYPYFKSFDNETHPIFYYQCGLLHITKEVLMLQRENTVLIRYHFDSNDSNTSKFIRILPFIAYRDFHWLTKANNDITNQFETCYNGIKLTPYPSMPTLYLQTNASFKFDSAPDWYHNFEYAEEKRRGFYEYREDLYKPGVFTINFNHRNEIIFSCSLLEKNEDLAALWYHELEHRNHQSHHNLSNKDSLLDILKNTAKQFIITKNQDHLSIIAGYHWFLEWGRDAMIALPGLTLYSGLEQECLNVLKYFASYEKWGLIPNFIDEGTENHAYDTVDASLWFCWATQQYYAKTRDLDSVEKFLWPTIKSIFNYYQLGTAYNIKQQENGLIYAGNPQVKLTWMDVMIDQVPVTPRTGMQVEINALWYNALCFMKEIAAEINDPVLEKVTPLIDQVKLSYQNVFWDEKHGYLRDYVNDNETNTAIRPNQIFAVSMPFSPLIQRMAEQVVATVTKHLLTPYGLRTLSPEDPNYMGRYEGGPKERDSAYHQGTVWPWLLGHYAEALIKTNHKSAHNLLQPCLAALQKHVIGDAGLNCVSEIFDGDPPHRAHGCINQAWSVSELIRILHFVDEKT